jgi:hypothetical protein
MFQGSSSEFVANFARVPVPRVRENQQTWSFLLQGLIKKASSDSPLFPKLGISWNLRLRRTFGVLRPNLWQIQLHPRHDPNESDPPCKETMI